MKQVVIKKRERMAQAILAADRVVDKGSVLGLISARNVDLASAIIGAKTDAIARVARILLC